MRRREFLNRCVGTGLTAAAGCAVRAGSASGDGPTELQSDRPGFGLFDVGLPTNLVNTPR